MVRDDAPEVTTKADVWALGCILLQLSSGALWPAEMSAHEIAGEIHDEQAPAIPGTLPPALQDVLTGCFQAKPEKRPTIESVLQVSASALADLFLRHVNAFSIVASWIMLAFCPCSTYALG